MVLRQQFKSADHVIFAQAGISGLFDFYEDSGTLAGMTVFE